jgi:hypothetical protein
MKPSEIKSLILGSLDEKTDPETASRKLEEEGVSYDFSMGFSKRVTDRIFSVPEAVVNEIEFVKSMRFIFNRVALTGIAAIILLLVSLFLTEGSLTLNSFLGMGNTYDEGIVYLLTGN